MSSRPITSIGRSDPRLTPEAHGSGQDVESRSSRASNRTRTIAPPRGNEGELNALLSLQRTRLAKCTEDKSTSSSSSVTVKFYDLPLYARSNFGSQADSRSLADSRWSTAATFGSHSTTASGLADWILGQDSGSTSENSHGSRFVASSVGSRADSRGNAATTVDGTTSTANQLAEWVFNEDTR